MEEYQEYSTFWQVKILYDRGTFTKEILKELCYRPNRICQMYITKSDYKKITGEDWTPLEAK